MGEKAKDRAHVRSHTRPGADKRLHACAQVEEGSPRGTVQEIRRKASKIAPAYNKGALQYLPDEKGD